MMSEFKYKVGEMVEIKMAFASPGVDLSNAHGIPAKVSKQISRNGSPQYKLVGLSGYFPETCLYPSKA